VTAPEPAPVMLTPSGALIIVLIGDPLGLWEGLRAAYLRQRPAATATDGTSYPVINVGDVEHVIAAWERAIRRDYIEDRDKEGVRDAWAVYVGAVRAAVRGLPAWAPFAGSSELWCVVSLRLARALSGMYRPPSSLDQHLESLPGAAASAALALPRLALGAAPAVLGAAAGGFTDAIGGAASNAWRALAVPLLIGTAVVVGAIVIVPRLLPSGRAASAARGAVA